MRYVAVPTGVATNDQASRADATGQVPERVVAEDTGNPSRHCLKMVPDGAGMLILARRPFPSPQPYAEVGPYSFAPTAVRKMAPRWCRKFSPRRTTSCVGTGQMTGSSMALVRWYQPQDPFAR